MCELCDENAFSELNDGCARIDVVQPCGATVQAVSTASETSNDNGLHCIPSISREFCITLCFHRTCSNILKCQVWLKAVI